MDDFKQKSDEKPAYIETDAAPYLKARLDVLKIVKLHETFNSKTIDRINKALNINLYDWQIDYLRGNDNALIGKGRGAGKTYVKFIRIFMSYDDDIIYRTHYDKDMYDDISEAISPDYSSSFHILKYNLKLYDDIINKPLKKAGFKTINIIF
ncbi:hypothetical protein A5816_003107 [Enterococcus sp. 3G1_DIV0629]|uniref:hypothetical protein n=1 Tax=Enterococcus sp. (strain 3G1_DIV0629) TaxID=1834176 RepID=UPI000A33CA2F|nr:hypothetical protein [Enterococcus sp. 3G1_DIV0629]OTO21968.1 hypothetical protein A5816_003107 [Enterococcus sp. 3G1_DIV0629]